MDSKLRCVFDIPEDKKGPSSPGTKNATGKFRFNPKQPTTVDDKTKTINRFYSVLFAEDIKLKQNTTSGSESTQNSGTGDDKVMI